MGIAVSVRAVLLDPAILLSKAPATPNAMVAGCTLRACVHRGGEAGRDPNVEWTEVTRWSARLSSSRSASARCSPSTDRRSTSASPSTSRLHDMWFQVCPRPPPPTHTHPHTHTYTHTHTHTHSPTHHHARAHARAPKPLKSVGRCRGGVGRGVCCGRGDRPKRVVAAARTGSDGVARKNRAAQWPQGEH